MATFRVRPLGHGWSRVALPDGTSSTHEQLLTLFFNALETVPELRGLPRELDAYDVQVLGRAIAVYHPDVDQHVFRAEFAHADDQER
ncbi:hypothetical protein ACFV3R_33025 [Streptomyces sp. NPDC059740]|uniref:hypothetical protein n=1 Tax=Streptomyces TaxID=1883 RepID=UPI00117E6635|nr:hypothetical protein [Streptomyces rhizosphaericus]